MSHRSLAWWPYTATFHVFYGSNFLCNSGIFERTLFIEAPSLESALYRETLILSTVGIVFFMAATTCFLLALAKFKVIAALFAEQVNGIKDDLSTTLDVSTSEEKL